MDDFDDFLNQLPNPGAPVSNYNNNQNLGDDLDALLGEMENFQVPPVSQQQNQFASSFQPQQTYSNMNQSNDLDDLLGQLSSPVSVPPTRTTTTTTTTVIQTTSTSLDDELDELMNLTEPDRKPPQVPAPVVQATPVEDLDDLMNQMGTPVQPQGRTLTRQPSGVRIRSVINQQAKNQSNPSTPTQTDDVSSLINQFNSPPPVAANPRPLPNAPNPAPVSNARPVSKVNNAPKVNTPTDDLDDLMNQFNTPAPVPSQSARGAPKVNTPPPTNDLDDLMNQLSAPSQVNAPVSHNARAAPRVNTPPPTNDLDDLMNQLSVGAPSQYNAAPQNSRAAPKVNTPPPTNDLDDLMNQLSVGGSSQYNAAPVSAPNARPVSKVNTPPSRASQQPPSSDLDDLMNEFNIPPTPRTTVNVQQTTTTTTTSTYNPPAGDDLDELMNSLSTTKPSAQLQQTQQFQSSYQSPQTQGGYQSPSSVQRTSVTVQQTRGASPAHNLNNSTSELDDLLSSLETPTSLPPHVQTTQTQTHTQVRSGNSPSLGSSLDDLDSLMAGLNSPTPGGMRGSVPNANQLNRGPAPQTNNRPVSTFGAPGSPGRGQPAMGSPIAPGPGQFGRGQQPVNNFGSPSVGAGPGQFGRGQPPVNNFSSPNPAMGRGVAPQQNSPFNSGGRGAVPPVGRGVGSPNVGGRGRGFGADPNQLDQLLGSLSNQMNNIKDIEASKGVCHFCQKYIYAECMQAMGRVYHPDHFVCSSCQKPLGTSSFYETNGEPNCETCYQNMFCPRCAYCNQAIADRCINALNQKWHVNCFVCNSCCQPFPSGSFFEKGGMPYCQPCFQGTFSSKCAGCGNMASGQLINALGQKWHSQCFCCSYCRRPFNGLPYFEKDGKPYCEQHYHTSAGSVCAGCRTAIVGRCVDALGQKWHPEHFVCSYCMNPLSGGGYTEQHGSPYCQECFANLF